MMAAVAEAQVARAEVSGAAAGVDAAATSGSADAAAGPVGRRGAAGGAGIASGSSTSTGAAAAASGGTNGGDGSCCGGCGGGAGGLGGSRLSDGHREGGDFEGRAREEGGGSGCGRTGEGDGGREERRQRKGWRRGGCWDAGGRGGRSGLDGRGEGIKSDGVPGSSAFCRFALQAAFMHVGHARTPPAATHVPLARTPSRFESTSLANFLHSPTWHSGSCTSGYLAINCACRCSCPPLFLCMQWATPGVHAADTTDSATRAYLASCRNIAPRLDARTRILPRITRR